MEMIRCLTEGSRAALKSNRHYGAVVKQRLDKSKVNRYTLVLMERSRLDMSVVVWYNIR